MYKKLLPVFFVATCASTQVFADNFADNIILDRLHAKHSQPQHSSVQKIQSSAQHYTNFSGTWNGKCTDDTGEESDFNPITIQNDTSHMIIHDDDGFSTQYIINEVSSKTHSRSSSSPYIRYSNMHEVLYWSDHGNILNMDDSYFGHDDKEDTIFLDQEITHVTFQLNGDGLIMEYSSDEYNAFDYHVHLTYHKKCVLKKIK